MNYVYGMPVEYAFGNMTQKHASQMSYEPTLGDNLKNQVLQNDVQHINTNMFLISVCEPLQLPLQTHVTNESSDTLGASLQSHQQVLWEMCFLPRAYMQIQQVPFKPLVPSTPVQKLTTTDV